jgi:MtN3 and saliva related transmembrane protein
MDIPASWIGIAAGILTGTSLLLQLVKIVREKKAVGISFAMLAVLMAGLILWVWYGIRRDDWPLIVTNAFSLIVNIAIMILMFIYRKNS